MVIQLEQIVSHFVISNFQFWQKKVQHYTKNSTLYLRTDNEVSLVADTEAGLSWSIFGRQGCHSGGHFIGVSRLLLPCSISQNPCKDQTLAALPPVAALKYTYKCMLFRKYELQINDNICLSCSNVNRHVSSGGGAYAPTDFGQISAPSLLRPPDFWPRLLLLAPPDFQTLRHAWTVIPHSQTLVIQ